MSPRALLLRLASPLALVAAPVLAQATSTPREAFEDALAADPFFSKIDLECDARFAPLHVYVQPPKKADPEYAPRVAAELGAQHALLEAALEDLVGEEGPAPPAERFLPVAVLASRADFDTYRKLDADRVRGIYRSAGTYLVGPDVAVVFESPFDEARGPDVRRFEARTAMLAQLLDERIDGDRVRLFDWLAAGTLDRLASTVGVEEGRRSPATEFPEGVAKFVLGVRTASRREHMLHSFGVLATIRHWSAIATHLRRIDARSGRAQARYEGVEWSFLRQATMATWFLWERHEPRTRRLFVDWMRGENPGLSFAREFPDVAALDEEFRAWLQAEAGLVDPENAYDFSAPHVPDTLTQKRPAPEAPPEELDRGSVGLALVAPSPHERLTLAFLALERGRTGEALGWLEGLEAERPDDAEWTGWIGRERERVLAWRALRDEFAATLAATGIELTFERDGKRTRVRTVEVADDVLRFEKNRTGIAEVRVEELDPRILARAIPKEQRGWAAALPEVWTRDARARRALRDRAPEVVALRADVEGLHPRLAEARAALGAFLELAELPPPADAEAARAQLDLARGHLARFLADEAFAARRGLLEAWVRGRLVRVVEGRSLAELAGGRVERLGDGRVAVVHEFDGSGGLPLHEVEGLGERLHSNEVSVLGLVEPSFEVRDGALRGLGRRSLVHPLFLGSPLRFSAVLTYVGDAERVEWPFTLFWGFATGTGGDGLWLEGYWRVHALVDGRQEYESLPPGQMTQGLPYVVELVQEGAAVRGRSNGREIGPVACPEAVVGRFALLANSAWPFQVSGLRLEGRFGEAERERSHAAWVERAEVEFWTELDR